MDKETKGWCEATGLTSNTVKFHTIQAICAMTAAVIPGVSLSLAQRCLLKKAVLKA